MEVLMSERRPFLLTVVLAEGTLTQEPEAGDSRTDFPSVYAVRPQQSPPPADGLNQEMQNLGAGWSGGVEETAEMLPHIIHYFLN